MHRSAHRAHLRAARKHRSTRHRTKAHHAAKRAARKVKRRGTSRTHRIKHPRLLSAKRRKGAKKPSFRFKGSFHHMTDAPKRY